MTAKPQEKPRTEQRGLSRNWEEVSYALSQIVDGYEKVNHVISFGTDERLRESGLKLLLVPGAEILDLGCGPGTMSQAALAVEPNLKTIVQSDALTVMLRESKRRNIRKVSALINNVFEFLPFRDFSFDTVVAGFALRDSKDLKASISEVSRVLKPKGQLLLVDLGKPDSVWRSSIVGMFWLVVVPIMAVVAIGSKGSLYRALHLTYRHLPRNSELVSLYQEKFREVRTRKKMLDGVITMICIK